MSTKLYFTAMGLGILIKAGLTPAPQDNARSGQRPAAGKTQKWTAYCRRAGGGEINMDYSNAEIAESFSLWREFYDVAGLERCDAILRKSRGRC